MKPATYRINGKRVSRREFIQHSTCAPHTVAQKQPPRLAAETHTISDGAGVHPKDAADAEAFSRKIGVPTHFDPQTGQAHFRSHAHRRKYLKRIGMFDRDGYS